VVTVPRRVFQRLLPERPIPEKCVEAYYLQRTRFESIAGRKLRQRQLTEDGNVEIGGRDLQPLHLWMTLLLSSSYLAAEDCMVNHQHDDRANDCPDHAV
jgi:hypothetical protein